MQRKADQIDFLKKFLAITGGLSVKETIANLVLLFSHVSIFPVLRISEDINIFLLTLSADILAILNIIRFFYGNWMYLSLSAQEQDTAVLVDFLITIIQSLAFIAIGYSEIPDSFLISFLFVLLVDVLGFAILKISKKIKDTSIDDLPDETDKLELGWIINNGIHFVLICSAFLIHLVNQSIFLLALALLFVLTNTIIAFSISFRLYVPVANEASSMAE